MAAFESVFGIFLMAGVGFLLAKRGWFDEPKSQALVSKLVVNVALPPYMVSNLMGSFDREGLLETLPGLPFPFAIMGICFLLSMGLARIFKLPANRRGTFASMFALSNTIFIGLPVNMMIFGDKSVPYVLLYYIANTTLWWTVGVYGISGDGQGRGTKILSFETVKKIFSPPLIGFLIATLLILLGIRLPRVVLDVCKYLGNMTTPLSMLFIGIVIAKADWRKMRPDLSLFLLLFGRFILSPALAFAFSTWAGFPLLMRNVFVIQASMPAMTQTSIIARVYDADYEYAALMTALTTLISLVTIPIFSAMLK